MKSFRTRGSQLTVREKSIQNLNALVSGIQSNRNIQLFLIALILVGITLFTFLYSILSNGVLQFNGSASYIDIAKNIATKGLYSLNGTGPTAYRAPVYPFYLSLWVWLFGGQFAFPAQFVQSLFDLATGVLIVLISLNVFQSKLAAGISFLLYAIHVAFHLEAIAMRETVLFAFLTAAFFYLISLDRRSFLHYVLLSALASLLYLTRATGVVAVFFVFLDLLKHRGNFRTFLVNAMLIVATAFLIIFPWQQFVYENFHTLSFTPTSVGGHTLYYGNNPDFATISPYIDIDKYQPYIREILSENGIDYNDEVAHDQFMRTLAVNYIKEHPVLFVRNAFIKLFALYSPLHTPLGSGDLVGPLGSVKIENFRFSTLTTSLIGFPAVLLILIGVFLYVWQTLASRKVTWTEFLIYLFVGFVTGLHLLYHAESRFRYPIDPLLILLAGSAYANVLRNQKSLPFQERTQD